MLRPRCRHHLVLKPLHGGEHRRGGVAPLASPQPRDLDARVGVDLRGEVGAVQAAALDKVDEELNR